MGRRIPLSDTVRWEIATKISSEISVLYGQFLRDAIGDDSDRIEQQVWVILAREAKKIAHTYGLPVRTAGEIADTLRTIITIFFGPETKSELAVFDNDRAVLMIRRCPFQVREKELQSATEAIFNRCLAFSIAAVETLNPEYTLRFVRSACQGDRHCEMRIAGKEIVEAQEQKE